VSKDKTYIYVNVQADGAVPGSNSILSLEAVALLAGHETPISTFEIKLASLPEATPDTETQDWRKEQDTSNLIDPQVAMQEFREWVQKLGGNPLLAVYPSWDFMWLHWYLVRFPGAEGTPFNPGPLSPKVMLRGVLPAFE